MPRRTVVDPRFPCRLRQLMSQRGMSVRELASLTYLAKSLVGDYTTGRRPPSPKRARDLDKALGAGGELAALVREDDPLTYAARHPGRVDRAAVAQLADQLAIARTTEDEVGAAPMLSTAADHLTTVAELAREARAPVRPALVAVGAQWAQWAGWLDLAVGRYGRAGAHLDRALEWALEAGDQEMVATVLSFRGHRAWLMGDLGSMVGLTEAALRDDQIHVGQRAYDRYQLARGHAGVGDRRPAVEALAVGADLADEAVAYTGPRPPWHYYRSTAFFDLEHGLVRAHLGERCRAEELVGAGLAGLPAEMRHAEWTAMYRAAVSAP